MSNDNRIKLSDVFDFSEGKERVLLDAFVMYNEGKISHNQMISFIEHGLCRPLVGNEKHKLKQTATECYLNRSGSTLIVNDASEDLPAIQQEGDDAKYYTVAIEGFACKFQAMYANIDGVVSWYTSFCSKITGNVTKWIDTSEL